MLRYRDFKEHTKSPSSRVWMAFAKGLGFVALPVLRLLCWVLPPLRRAIRNTSASRMGAAFRTRDRGDHQGAFALAMDGLARCRFASDKQRAEFMADLNWWTFLDLAADRPRTSTFPRPREGATVKRRGMRTSSAASAVVEPHPPADDPDRARDPDGWAAGNGT